MVEQVKTKLHFVCFLLFSKEIASIKVTSKFHEKDRVVSSSLTLPTKCPADGIGIHTGLRDQVFRVRLPGGVLKPII